MRKAHINIGSNLGNRLALLELAVASVSTLSEGATVCSGVVESAPWGFDSPNGFMNIGVEILTSLPSAALLGRLIEIQNSIAPASHRDAAGGYVDRELDIDLIFVDDLVVDSPLLTLPHPRMQLRDFVLRPVAELSPFWRHPLLGLTARQMLERLA